MKQPWYTPSRAPDEVIGSADRPYILRWHLFRKWSRVLENVYLHCVKRSDDDRALHCHPWWSISIILRTGYWEHVPKYPEYYANCGCGEEHHACREVLRIWRGPGSIIFRRSDAIHRLELEPGLPDTWTIFITGPKVREWGFYCLNGWKHWREFVRGGC